METSMQRDKRTHKIIGAAMEVHNIMGPGRLEAVYQKCLEIEFGARKLRNPEEPQIPYGILLNCYPVGITPTISYGS